MNIKTYSENDPFPSNCWFADYQPQKEYLRDILQGDVIIRKRDDCSTTVLFSIPIGGTRGIEESKAEKIINLVLTELNK